MACSDQVTGNDLENTKLDTVTVAEVATSRDGGVQSGDQINFTTTRFGDQVDTLIGRLSKLGVKFPPIDWVASTQVVDQVQSYRYPPGTGDIYIPLVEVPFTTGATFTPSNWVLYQSGIADDLSIEINVDSVSDMQLLLPSSGKRIKTRGYSSPNDGGSAEYLAMTLAEYGQTPDESFKAFTLANGLVGVFLKDFQFGNFRANSSDSGAITAVVSDPNAWSDDFGTRLHIEPQEQVTTGTGGALKIFGDAFRNGPPTYRDFGLYFSADQAGDTGYYGEGVFYLNSKSVGVNTPDVAVTFQDGQYYAWKATLLPAASAGGVNRAVTLFGKTESTTAYDLAKCVQEVDGWIGFENTLSGLAWWGWNGGFSAKLNVTNSADFVDTDELNLSLNEQNVLQLSKERTRISDGSGNIKIELKNSGLDQGLKAETRVLGRQAGPITSGGSVSSAGFNSVVFSYPSAATLTNLTDGIAGQEVTIISTNSNLTIQNNANFSLVSGANFNIPANTAIKFIYVEATSQWVEVGGS